MNALNYGTMALTSELVTPALAARWLEFNNTNRILRKETVAKYARDMESGDWHLKPIPICFDENGNLGNGQHTLTAIVQTGLPQLLLISRKTPKISIAMMDMGLSRTISDVAHFLGEDLQSRASAVAKTMAFGLAAGKWSFHELFDAYVTHKEAIDFALHGRPKKVGFSAPVLAVCARAAYTQDRQKISRFLDILETGVVADSSESAAIRLRDFLRGRNSAGLAAQREAYRKTQSSLAAFLKGTPLAKIYGIADEVFPIPDNKSGAVGQGNAS